MFLFSYHVWPPSSSECSTLVYVLYLDDAHAQVLRPFNAARRSSALPKAVYRYSASLWATHNFSDYCTTHCAQVLRLFVKGLSNIRWKLGYFLPVYLHLSWLLSSPLCLPLPLLSLSSSKSPTQQQECSSKLHFCPNFWPAYSSMILDRPSIPVYPSVNI
jgi:hypothetical protein